MCRDSCSASWLRDEITGRCSSSPMILRRRCGPAGLTGPRAGSSGQPPSSPASWQHSPGRDLSTAHPCRSPLRTPAADSTLALIAAVTRPGRRSVRTHRLANRLTLSRQRQSRWKPTGQVCLSTRLTKQANQPNRRAWRVQEMSALQQLSEPAEPGALARGLPRSGQPTPQAAPRT